MGDNRPARYVEEDGRVIYRASSLGMCDKVFVALAMGYDPRAHPAWFQEILDEGTANESVIRGMWEQDMDFPPGTVEGIGRVVEMEILDGVWVRGSIDGHHGRLVVTLNEFKKIRDSGWLRYLQSGVEFQANYPMQTSFYMFALGEAEGQEWVPMQFTGGRYVQDEKTEEWAVTEVYSHEYIDPPVPLLAIKRRIAKLERLIKETTAVGDMECSVKMYPCPFYYLHDDDDDEPPIRPSDEIVEPLITEFTTLEARRQELAPELARIEKDQKRVKEGVKAWLEASGQDSGDVSTVTIDNQEYYLKYLVSPRAGYEVKPSEQTRVTIRAKEEGKSAPKKSSPRKRAAKPKVEDSETQGATEQEATQAPVTKRLAPRPT